MVAPSQVPPRNSPAPKRVSRVELNPHRPSPLIRSTNKRPTLFFRKAPDRRPWAFGRNQLVVLVETDVDPPPPAAGAPLPLVLLMRRAIAVAAAIPPTASKAALSLACARCTPAGIPGLSAPSPAKAELETITIQAKASVAVQRIKTPPKNLVRKVRCKREKCQFRKGCARHVQTPRLRRSKTFAGRISA